MQGSEDDRTFTETAALFIKSSYTQAMLDSGSKEQPRQRRQSKDAPFLCLVWWR